jgi:hypothetical protein
LQREDEAAMMAELAAQAEHEEEQDVKQVVQAIQHTETGYNSDSSYEEVEVTDSEGEEDDPARASGSGTHGHDGEAGQDPQEGGEEAPVEFGEDDIAWQLEAMGEDYGLDPGEYGEGAEGEWDEGAEGLPFTEEDAANLFRDLLDDYRITPFTPWDKVVADESEASILNDDRYTVLPNMRTRKEVFDAWAKNKAAQIKQERAAMVRTEYAHAQWLEKDLEWKLTRAKRLVMGWRELGLLEEKRIRAWIRSGGQFEFGDHYEDEE